MAAICSLLGASSALADSSFSSTQTIPVPPASNFSGASAGGDGWAVALSDTQVFNVFHHQSYLGVNCHNQTDASTCTGYPKTITDGSGNAFATSGQPGMYFDQGSGHLYVFATRSVDTTGGVVCIDTTSSSSNPFCGFTQLTDTGDAPMPRGISDISMPMQVGTKLYAFNYANGTGAGGGSGTRNEVLCFDLSTDSACSGQPYAVDIGAGTVSSSTFPEPSVAAISNQLIIPVDTSAGSLLACFDTTKGSSCAGSGWPATSPIATGNVGSPFPLLTSSGTITGFCLPTGTDQCFNLDGTNASTPSGMTNVIGSASPWNGPAVAIGPRIYVPNGTYNSNTGDVQCFDYTTDASCTGFPKTFSNLGYLYTVNPDPQRPTCLWVNADNGTSQIQNFDAYTGGACGAGPVRALASQFVVSAPACTPTSYTSLQVLSPAPSAYTSGSVTFVNGAGDTIQGTSPVPLDSNGTADLTGFSYNSSTGLPQFLITLNGLTGPPTSVKLQLNWSGTNDSTCVGPNTSVDGAPAYSTAPSISGIPHVGLTLTADPGDWSPASTFTYQWWDCDAASSGSVGTNCSKITSATSPTYVPTGTDIGHSLEATVVATSGGVSSDPIATAVTDPVVAHTAAAAVTVSSSPPWIVANGTSTATVTATVTDAYGSPVPGETVTFSSNGGQTFGSTTDNGDGTYSATVTSTTTAGSYAITATDTSASLSGATSLTQFAPTGPATHIALTLSPTSILADGVSSTVATALVTDSSNNAVTNDPISFAGSGGQAVGPVKIGPLPGEYQATITSTNAIGPATITATDANVSTISGKATLTQTSPATGVAVSLDNPSITADGVSVSHATISVTDAQGNPVDEPASEVTLTSNGGQSITPVTAGNNPGTYTATITSTKIAGNSTITAKDLDPQAQPSGTTLLNQHAGPAANVALSLAPASITANGSSTSTATATVTDQYGNKVSGESGLQITDSGTGAPTIGSPVTDNGDGTYTAPITSSTTAGQYTISATDGALSNTASLTEVHDKAAYVTVSLSPSSITADGVSTSTATATVTDLYGNLISDEPLSDVQFTSDGGQGIGAVALGSNPGQYVATITSTKTAGTSTIKVKDTNSPAQPSGTATLTQVAGQAVGSNGNLYWGNFEDSNTYSDGWIGTANPDGTNVNENFIHTGQGVEGVFQYGNYIYWTNAPHGTIGRANVDGTGANPSFITLTNGPGGNQPWPSDIVVTAQHIYWADNYGSIGEADLDGSNANDQFIVPSGAYPWGLAVDAQHIYWTDMANNTVGEANLDGTGVNDSLITGIGSAFAGVAVDGQHIYWGDGANNEIGRANLDGSSPDYSFIANVYPNDGQLWVNSQHIYWTDFTGGSVGEANLDGTGANDSFIGNGGYFTVGVFSGGNALALSPTSIRADGTSTSLATFTLHDANGNPVTGDLSSVSITASDVGSSGVAPSVGPVTLGPVPGTYQAWITSTTTAGASTITATDSAPNPVVTATATLTQVAGPAAYVNLAVPSQLTAGGSAGQASATVTDLYGNPVSDPASDVTITDTGTGAPTIGSVSNGSQAGTYVASVTPGTKSGEFTATATDTAGPLAPIGTALLNVVAASPASVALQLAPSTLVADGRTQSIATATVEDTYGNPVLNQTVSITPGQVGTTAAPAITTPVPGTADGTYVATITSTKVAGTSSVSAADGAVDATPQALTQIPDQAAYVSVSLSRPSIVADGVSQTVATATVTDQNGNLVSGDNVGFVSSDAQHIGSVTAGPTPGTYVATITSTTKAGTSTITAADPTSLLKPSGSTTLTQVPGPATQVAVSLSPSSIVADGHSQSVATAAVSDQYGNAVSGDNVVFASSDTQHIGSVSAGATPGTYVATITSTTLDSPATITATDLSVPSHVSGSTKLTQVPGAADDVSLRLSPATITADGASQSVATATVTDPQGNPVSGETVTFASSGTQQIGSVSAGQFPGTYVATITSSTTPGDSTITATDTSGPGRPSGQATLTQEVGAPAHVSVSLSPSSISADGHSSSVATVSVSDAQGNPVSGASVSMTSSGAQAIGAVSAGAVAGTYQATITSTKDLGHWTITAWAGGAEGTAVLSQVDDALPSIQITTPVAGGIYLLHETIRASYACTDPLGITNILSCAGPNNNGAKVDTNELGTHAFAVSALNRGGHTARSKVHYVVVSARPLPSSPLVYLTGALRIGRSRVVVPIGCLSRYTLCTGTVTLRMTIMSRTRSGQVRYSYVTIGQASFRLRSGQKRVLRIAYQQALDPNGQLPTIILRVKQHGTAHRIVIN